MTLLEAAKKALNMWDSAHWNWWVEMGREMEALRTAIAAEEAKPAYVPGNTAKDIIACMEKMRGHSLNSEHMYAYRDATRIAIEDLAAERDELRAKLAAMESAEPVAMVAACCGRRECGGECGNDWQGMRPAYTPMTDEEMWEAYDKGLTPNDSATTGLRAIERAVLARLGVTP